MVVALEERWRETRAAACDPLTNAARGRDACGINHDELVDTVTGPLRDELREVREAAMKTDAASYMVLLERFRRQSDTIRDYQGFVARVRDVADSGDAGKALDGALADLFAVLPQVP